jgi:lysine-N-methylase
MGRRLSRFCGVGRRPAKCYAQSVTWPAQRLQPRSYSAFRCIGADCEDTCCVGWGVNVDRGTYEAYQRCDDPELGPALHQLIAINPASNGDDNYAKIAITGDGCPFLAEGLCSIQKKLGEKYLSKMCATYPRVMSLVDDVLYRSLHLSCPEAARVVLLDPCPLQFDNDQHLRDGSRLGNLSMLNTSSPKYTDKPYPHFHQVRSLVISILQNRNYPLWQRMVLLASFCDQLNEHPQTAKVLEGFEDAIARRLFDDSLGQLQAQPTAQLEIVVELIVDRIGSDFTGLRFRECYQEFMSGLHWTGDSTMEDLGARYAAAHAEYYAPFMSRHEYMLEHYLVNYVHGRLFPFGPQETTQNLGVQHVISSITKQYVLMAIYYAVIKTGLIGVAAFHKTAFGVDHVLKMIQSSAKTFEHSVAFPERALKILSSHNMQNCLSMAVLLQN